MVIVSGSKWFELLVTTISIKCCRGQIWTAIDNSKNSCPYQYDSYKREIRGLFNLTCLTCTYQVRFWYLVGNIEPCQVPTPFWIQKLRKASFSTFNSANYLYQGLLLIVAVTYLTHSFALLIVNLKLCVNLLSINWFCGSFTDSTNQSVG